jgi:predicted MPP superfamily phosphohydrolase
VNRFHYIIPDYHARPSKNINVANNRRADWIGEDILAEQPDVIIDIGDFADMYSLCKQAEGKAEFARANYQDDLKACWDASKKIFGRIRKYNDTRCRLKKKQYHPLIIRCLGNHEMRIERYLEKNPKFDKWMSVDDLAYGYYGEEVIPFLQPKIIDSISYCHYYYQSNQNYAATTASAMLQRNHMSCIQGHTHRRDFAEQVRADGTRITALMVGCALDPTDEDSINWAGYQSNEAWWKGVVKLRAVTTDGEILDHQFTSMEELQKQYT